MLRPAITPLTVASVVIAVLAFALPWLSYGSAVVELAVLLNFILWSPVVWAIVTIAALITYKRHAMWILLGTPVSLFNLVYFALTFSPCDPTGTRCL